MAKATVRRVIGAAAKLAESSETDAELLRRYAADADQEAFAAIVRRHTNVVLGVCRRSLASATDAEDACQAVFVVLAKKAKSGRWQPSIVNWLYTTARRVSKDARVAADRRAKHEGKAGRPDESSPIDQMTGRELLAVIDDELDRLSGLYREPLVLCFLEGMSREDVANRLGLPAGTVKTRLERGRKKLADALTKRGVALGAGLLTLATTSPAGASPPRLLDSILAAAHGTPSASVAALVRGVAVNTWKSKTVLAVVVLFGVAVGTTLLTRDVGAGDNPMPKAERAEKEQPKAAPADAKPGEKTIRGVVRGPDGKPAAGVAINTLKEGNFNKPVTAELTKTAADGTFAATLPPLPVGRPDYRFIVAAKPGFGPDWVRAADIDGPVTLTLVADDVVVTGTVTDLEGKPVPHAKVDIKAVAAGDLGKVWEQWPQGPYLAIRAANKELHWPPLGGLPDELTADAAGKFEVKGVGNGRLLAFTVSGKGIETAGCRVVTDPKFDPKTVPQPTQATMPGGSFMPGPHLYGPTFTHAGKPSQAITGTVTDAATGRPVAGVQVNAGPDGPHWYENGGGSTKTDAAGKYRVTGVAKSARVRVSVFPTPTMPYFQYTATVAGKPGLTEIAADLKLTRGVTAKVRVVEKGTGKPVLGAGIRYTALADNKHYADLMRQKAAEGGMAWNTDADGRAEFVVLPGAGIVMAQGETRGRNAGTEFTQVRIRKADLPRADLTNMNGLGECFSAADGHIITLHSLSGYGIIEPKLGDDTVEVTIEFDRGKRAAGKVLTPDGKPAVGVTAYKLTACYDYPTKLKDGTFTAIALEPDFPRTVLFADADKKLAASVDLKGDEKELVVKLQPWGKLTGRLLDADGKPMPGASVSAYPANGMKHMSFGTVLRDRTLTTDADGRFALDVPGGPAEYLVGFSVKNKYVDIGRKPNDAGRAVKPGETVDLGDIKAKGE